MLEKPVSSNTRETIVVIAARIMTTNKNKRIKNGESRVMSALGEIGGIEGAVQIGGGGAASERDGGYA